MKVECVVKFLDAETGDVHEVGERFDVTKERFEEINGTKYGQLVREVKTRAPKKVEE